MPRTPDQNGSFGSSLRAPSLTRKRKNWRIAERCRASVRGARRRVVAAAR